MAIALGIAALAAITVARVRLIDALPDQGYFAKYSTVADQILTGHTPRGRLLDFSPLYLWFVVALRGLGLGLHAIRTLQIALVSASALLLSMAARRWGMIAVIAAPLLLLGSRAALVCATDLEPETLILLFDAAALAALLWKDDERHNALAGLLLGLSAICRPVALLAIAGLIVTRRSWKLGAAAILPIAVMIGVNFSLTGEVALMDPGTVFYEGMNPSAGGYEGVQPRLVNDLEQRSSDPDTLHEAYRFLASQALGQEVTRAESNRYWTGKALAFARAYPGAALRLVVRKAWFAIHSHDAYDLVTMARKNVLLERVPFIPFGLLVGLGIAALLMRIRGMAPVVVFAAAGAVTLVVFYVTARERNAMLAPMIVLAAAGLAEIVVRKRLFLAVAAVMIALLLTIDGPAQREDAAGWTGARNGFDAALALERQGHWREADALLQRLETAGYRPMRENRAVSSLAWYRARAAAHLGAPRSEIVALLRRADEEAPGNEHVLAGLAKIGDTAALRRLFDIHDPMTARRALSEGI